MKPQPQSPVMVPGFKRLDAATKHARQYKVELLILIAVFTALMWLITLLIRG